MDASHDKQRDEELPLWETPVLVSLELSETTAGIFCAAQENFDSAILDFLLGTDPNCLIG